MRSGLHSWLVGILIFCFSSASLAASVPAYSGRMNAAVSGVVQHKQSKYGFAANDPRVTGTVAGIGTGLTTIAVGVAGGAVAAVGWPALLVAAGISAVVGGAVTIASDAAIRWIFNDDGSIESVPDLTGSINVPGGYASLSVFCLRGACATSRESSCNAAPIVNFSSPVGSYLENFWRDGQCWSRTVYSSGSSVENCCSPPGAAVGCIGIGLSATAGVCPPSNFPEPEPEVFDDLPAAIAALPDAVLSEPIPDDTLALAANLAWQNGDAVGIPFDVHNPITAADVAAWRSTVSPDAVPNVGDFISPVAPAGSPSVPMPAPGTTPGTSPGGSPVTSPAPAPTPGTGEPVDLGPDPNSPPPHLDTPLAADILAPIFGLMPDFKSFVVTDRVGVCPAGSFTAFDREYQLNVHCDLFEEHRAIIQTFMLAFWLLSAAFIVMRA